MRKIAVVTGTRAEYGLLKNTLLEIKSSHKLTLQLIATGAHLSDEFGLSINEIKNDGFEIAEAIPILMNQRSKDNIAREMGLLMIQLSLAFSRLKPDMLLILGDRYEIFAAASTAMAMNIPIAHISGGEITEGAIDEQIRHSITKMSHIHFPGALPYEKNIINMGEEAWRVFNVGDPGIENIRKTKMLSKEQIYEELKVNIDASTLLMTFHPVTHEIENLPFQVDELFKALKILNMQTIITYPNADNGGDYIIKRINEFKNTNKNIYVYKNLGSKRYLSIMSMCAAVIGNSSSAIIEAPYFKIPVVNIGNRQKGRLMADNIICCSNKCEDIVSSVMNAISSSFVEKTRKIESLYGEGNTSKDIVNILENIQINEKLLKKKLIWS